ncbi:MAG TPA: Txe/YoeB family addiction module toxin [Alkalispirochaeta sp.]|nr:Txe/YoeB family addiction module toxin [Alkalispirochaeta sp.]
MTVSFHRTDLEEYHAWATVNRGNLRTPYAGSGKPEPLKHELAGFWSRRITAEHRLVYKVEADSAYIISCKYHYPS